MNLSTIYQRSKYNLSINHLKAHNNAETKTKKEKKNRVKNK